MKKSLHPSYIDGEVKCVCGSSMTVGSTRSEIKVEVCSSCHPFFTGNNRILDSEGMVEKFRKRFGLKES